MSTTGTEAGERVGGTTRHEEGVTETIPRDGAGSRGWRAMEEVSISFEKNKRRGADCLSMCAAKPRAGEERKENKNIQKQNNLRRG